jgi:hypothetical protein
MQFTIVRHGRHVVLFAVVVSSSALLGATGGFRMLVQLSDAAIESYDRAISDWAENTLERLNPSFPRCF